MKKIKIAEEMKVAREDQIKHKLHFQAIQGNDVIIWRHNYDSFVAQRERAEFQRVLAAQKGEIEKEKEEKVLKKVALDNHSQQLRKQINAREYNRIEERRGNTLIKGTTYPY